MKIAQQYIVEIVFDNFDPDAGQSIDVDVISAYIQKHLEDARMTGEASTWRPKGVKMVDVNVQYETDYEIEDI